MSAFSQAINNDDTADDDDYNEMLMVVVVMVMLSECGQMRNRLLSAYNSNQCRNM